MEVKVNTHTILMAVNKIATQNIRQRLDDFNQLDTVEELANFNEKLKDR